ncbi:MAG: hypothetical protein RRA94_14625, partial [Bacteroidota bacterium]|nr:hypothetical protein [Bacteroidota bacterium]
MKSQLHAGYVLPGVLSALTDSRKVSGEGLQALLSAWTRFDVETGVDLVGGKTLDDPVLLTAANLVSRGLPTLPGVEMQQHFDRCFGSTETRIDEGRRIVASCRGFSPAHTEAMLDTLRALDPRASEDAVPHNARMLRERMLRPENAGLLQLLLSPLASARLQAAFLALLLRGSLDFSAESLRLLIIERDVPAAAIAFADLEKLLTALLALEGKGRKLPVLEIRVLTTGAFAASKLHTVRAVKLLREESDFPEVDCCFDISMLLRSGPPADGASCAAPVTALLRSARDARQERRLHFGKPVRWKSACDEEKGKAPDANRMAAQQHLLRRLFRLAALSKERQQLLDRLLAQESLLVSLPADTGKSLLAHMAGLLQPAPSVILTPHSLLVMDQRDMLQEHLIDVDVALNDALKREELLEALRAFSARKALFCHVPASLVRHEEILGTLESMAGEGVVFAQCVIDDAQALSEWSDDFRPALPLSLPFAAQSLPAGKDVRLPLRLLTASVSYEILADLRRQLAQTGRAYVLRERQILRSARVLGAATRYYVLPTTTEGGNANDSDEERKAVLRSFIPQLPAFFEELQESVPTAQRLPERALRHFFDSSSRQGGIVFCAEASGPLGVTSRYAPTEQNAGIAETVTGVEGVRTGICIGEDGASAHVGRQVLAESDRDRHRFRRGEVNLLVATHACGIGLSHDATRYVLHATMPTGVERY